VVLLHQVWVTPFIPVVRAATEARALVVRAVVAAQVAPAGLVEQVVRARHLTTPAAAAVVLARLQAQQVQQALHRPQQT